MQKHINTCGLCDQPPVHRMDAHTHVMVTKTTEAQVAACTHKSMWSTVMCVATTRTHTQAHTPMCASHIPLYSSLSLKCIFTPSADNQAPLHDVNMQSEGQRSVIPVCLCLGVDKR